ncbi:putative translin [Helianthus annuus]|nr:putative translin [Helianthus annuus]
MKSVSRTLITLTTALSHRSINPNPKTLISATTATVSLRLNSTTTLTQQPTPRNHSFASMAAGDSSPASAAVEKQFDEFRHRLEESGSLRDRIRAVATQIESTTRMMHSSLLLIHQSRPIQGIRLQFYTLCLVFKFYM